MDVIRINSANDEFQVIESLKCNRVKRAKNHEIFIEGIESIKQALIAKIDISRIIVSDIDGVSDWAKAVIKSNHKHSRIIELDSDLYKKLCDRTDPSEMIITARIESNELANIQLSKAPFILLVDRPGDAGNLGSIIRTANSFDVDAFFIIGHSVDIYDPKVIRASVGSIFHTEIIQIKSMNEIGKYIKVEKERSGIKIIGTDSAGSVSLNDEAINRPIMLIIGNEAKGISVALKNMCDKIIRIPISGKANSLNVAAAAGIFMWEIYKNKRIAADAQGI
ncbi:MAG: RNA methyltransferase [Spirochaetaceae bacterium]|jgi:TrmH family RNA methyltransferase|nr:RNA methyltransferase [Spirochaetaceae bacterium]